jgi:hypothetical protein
VNDELVRAAGLVGSVTFLPLASHREVLADMAAADALLLIESDEPAGSLITPGKIFEYLASGRPILASSPRGPRPSSCGRPAPTGGRARRCRRRRRGPRALAGRGAAGDPAQGGSARSLRPPGARREAGGAPRGGLGTGGIGGTGGSVASGAGAGAGRAGMAGRGTCRDAAKSPMIEEGSAGSCS